MRNAAYVFSPTALGVACGVGAGALWGLVFIAPEMARDFTPLQLAVGRYLAYGVLSAALIAPRWRAVAPTLTPRDWLSLAWLSLAGNTLYYILLSTAVQTAGVAVASLIIGFLPVAVTIVGSRERAAPPLARLAPSLLLCAAGVLCIGWQALGEPAAERPLAGLLCAVGALVSWTAYAVGNARCLARLGHVTVHEWSLLTGLVTGAQAAALLPLAALADPVRHAPAAWANFAAVSVAVAVAGSILGNALWNRMSRLLPLTMVGQMIVFETLFALLYGFLWERRAPRPLEIAAFVLVTASVLACMAAHRRAAASRRVSDK